MKRENERKRKRISSSSSAHGRERRKKVSRTEDEHDDMKFVDARARVGYKVIQVLGSTRMAQSLRLSAVSTRRGGDVSNSAMRAKI